MSERLQRVAAAAERTRSGGEDAARAAKLRRSGWLLGVLALGFYLGFIAWNLLRAQAGG